MSIGWRLPALAHMRCRRLLRLLNVPRQTVMSTGHQPICPTPDLHLELRLRARHVLRFDTADWRELHILRRLPTVRRFRLPPLCGEQRLRQRPSLHRRLMRELHVGQPMRPKRSMHDAGWPLHVYRR